MFEYGTPDRPGPGTIEDVRPRPWRQIPSTIALNVALGRIARSARSKTGR